MLRKENLLIVPFANGWRKLTVGNQKNNTHGYGFGSQIYNPGSISYGNLSDRLLNGKTIVLLNSYDYASDKFTQVTFSNYGSLPERTLYLKREDKDTIPLSYETGESTQYIKYGICYFTAGDVGKTIDIYLGTTPP